MSETIEQEIAQRRESVLARIAKAAKSAGRSADEVVLVAVSKVQPDDRVDAMLGTGQRVFGENRVQEAQKRWSDRREQFPDLELRLIGPLQSNKSRDAVALFDVIETLDRPKLARTLAEAIQAEGRAPAIFIQINTGEEAQKAGVGPLEADAFISKVRKEFGIKPEGLMCIPPAGQAAGPHFALLAKIASRNGLAKLSMGMSADFETAIQFGATHVRVGTELFGARA